MKRRWLVAALLIVACGCGGAPQTTATTPEPGAARVDPDAARHPDLPKRLELLGGSVRVRVPETAEVQARPHSIMAADAPQEEETRVVLVPGQEMARFVLLAVEGFARGSGNIEKDAVLHLGHDAAELETHPVSVGSGLSAVTLTPRRDRSGEDQPLYVLGAVVERDDHSIFELAFFILPEMAGELDTWRTRARSIVESLEAGKPREPLRREHSLDTGTGQVLVMTAPRESTVTRQDGPDFYVYRVRELRDVGQEPGVIGIYVGGYPSFQYEQAGGVDPASVQTSAGTLLGQEAQWHTWEPRPGRRMSEAMASIGDRGRVHVFVSGPPERIDALQKAAEGMRLEGAP